MQLKIRIVDAKFLQFTYEGHILVLVPTGGDLLVTIEQRLRPELLVYLVSERKLLDAALSHPLNFSLFLAERSIKTPESNLSLFLSK